MSKLTNTQFWAQSSFNFGLQKSKNNTFTKDGKKTNPKTKDQVENVKNMKMDEDWVKKFEPQEIDDLAVHNRKIDQVIDFFKLCDHIKKNKSNRIALLTGPSGAGKTATIKVLAKSYNYEVLEWITPVDMDVDNFIIEKFNSNRESQLTLFKYFIFQSSRYGSLFSDFHKRLLLVEDFPNCIIRNPELLDEILEGYKTYGCFPIVFIATDSKSRGLNFSRNIFEPVKDKYDIIHISFNPIAPTLIKKALKRINSQISKEKSLGEIYNVPNQDTLDSICLFSNGDIRNAMTNLHFSILKSAKNAHSKQSKINKNIMTEKNTQSSVGRNETITLMHALGRVFHPKFEESNKKTFLHSPEELTNQFLTEDKNFINFIYANYLLYFTNVENVLEAANSLSLSDILQAEYQTNDSSVFGLNIAIRGVMVSNTNPKSGRILIKAPYKQECKFLRNYETQKLTDFIISKKIFATDMNSYINIIKRQ